MADQELRVAMIGGNGHHSLRGAFGRGAKLVAVASDGLDNAAKAFMQQPYAAGAPYFENYEEMLDQVKPEAISLGAWPARMFPYIMSALKRKVHVVTDKPIAVTPAQLRALRRQTEKNPRVLLLTEFTMRSAPAFMAAREAVRAGRVGDVVMVTAQKSYRFGASRPDFYKRRDSFPGTVMFVGCHVIGLAYWITGLKYAAALAGAKGNIAKKDYGEFEDHAIIMFKMENDVDAIMHMDYLRPAAAPTHGDDRIRIAGSKGVLEVRDERCLLLTQDQPPAELAHGGHDPDAGIEFVETIRGRGRGIYSTAESLYMADVLIKARDSVDKNRVIKMA